MTAYIMIGLPASGKSTWAKARMEEDKDIRITNNDLIRQNIYLTRKNNTWSPEVEKEVKKLREAQIAFAANNENNIIVDNTHMNPKTLRQTEDYCKSLGFTIAEVDFRHVTVDECIARDKVRPESDRVGEKVIREMATKYTKQPLPKWNITDKAIDCIIVDIDGTLADCGKRNPYDESSVYNDEVRHHVSFVVSCIIKSFPPVKLIIFSGRTEGCRSETERWLKDKAGLRNYVLVMRKVGDSRRDSVVKREFYNDYVKGKFNVMAVFDDRPQVIRELWKELNLPVFNCGVIDQEF